jgi:hypothetical protein
VLALHEISTRAFEVEGIHRRLQNAQARKPAQAPAKRLSTADRSYGALESAVGGCKCSIAMSLPLDEALIRIAVMKSSGTTSV